YGKTQGAGHKSKSPAEVSNVTSVSPQWFKDGVNAALLAPTAMNQQQFKLTLDNGAVEAKALRGICAKIDLGIVKYHFELIAGKENFHWK
ncbi:MAG: nitroreductase family protein, partial [Clostridia bacterium]